MMNFLQLIDNQLNIKIINNVQQFPLWKMKILFPADFADFFRRFSQIFVEFIKICVNLRKNRRNLRGKSIEFFKAEIAEQRLF
jgi:hypothetical protein